MMEENGNKIVLLDRFMRGETSLDEERLLLEWFRSTDSGEQILLFYKQKWEESSGLELSAEVQGRMFLKIKTKMQEAAKDNTANKSRKTRTFFGSRLLYAASVLLIVGLGIMSYHFISRPAVAKNEFIVEADKGQRAGITLPDGTKVWLNSNTKIKYDADYGQKDRAISLIGEAYFEVAKDKKHRFVVKAGGMEVEALGTSFNVKAYEEDEIFTATLFEGSIRASVGNKAETLLPSEFVRYNRKKGVMKVEMSDNVQYARIWRDNELAFNGETLGDIAVLLNRMYNVKVIFDSESIKKFRFSGVIKNNSLDNVIEIISLTAPIMYESKEDTIVLKEKL